MTAVGLPALPALASHDLDPNFAAIEAHKAAAVRFDTAVGVEFALEVEIPREDRQSSITAWNHVIDQTDDPRWIEAVKARNETCEAVDDLAWSFVENPPTTAAGAAALMAYITEMPEWAWPEDIERDLYRALATALVRIAGGVFMTANRKTRWKPKFGPH